MRVRDGSTRMGGWGGGGCWVGGGVKASRMTWKRDKARRRPVRCKGEPSTRRTRTTPDMWTIVTDRRHRSAALGGPAPPVGCARRTGATGRLRSADRRHRSVGCAQQLLGGGVGLGGPFGVRRGSAAELGAQRLVAAPAAEL